MADRELSFNPNSAGGRDGGKVGVAAPETYLPSDFGFKALV